MIAMKKISKKVKNTWEQREWHETRQSMHNGQVVFVLSWDEDYIMPL